MKKLLLFFVLVVVFLQNIQAQPAQFFIEIKEPNLIIGKYEGKHLKPKELKTYLLSEIHSTEIEQFFFSNKNERTLYYVHAMFGGVRPYHKSSIKKLAELKGIDKIVSIVWHTNRKTYKKQWPIAPKEGKLIADLMQYLWSNQDRQHHILAHSMGHRVLEGVFSNIDFSKIQLQIVLFAAADISTNAFENSLQELPENSERIIVYRHEKDRLLKTAHKKIGDERMGRHGILSISDSVFKNIHIENVTHLPKRKFFRYTNHGYWKRECLVFEDIQHRLLGEN